MASKNHRDQLILLPLAPPNSQFCHSAEASHPATGLAALSQECRICRLRVASIIIRRRPPLSVDQGFPSAIIADDRKPKVRYSS